MTTVPYFFHSFSVAGGCEDRCMQSGRARQSGLHTARDGAEAPERLPPEGSVDLFPAQANREIRKAGRGAFSQKFPDFPLSRLEISAEVPINQHSLKAGLRRDGSPAQNSPSECRLQLEACEGLQARIAVQLRMPARHPPHTRLPFARRVRLFLRPSV